MLAKVHSAAVLGIDSYPIEIEVNAGWGQTGGHHCRLAGCGGEGIARPREDRHREQRVQVRHGPDDD